MDIVQIVPYINEAASGPAYSVPRLCKSLQDQGARVQLHALAPLPEGLRDIAVPWPMNFWPHPRLGRSGQMLKGLTKLASTSDLFHGHSLWMFPNWYPYQASRGTDCKLVISPRGTLSKWSLNRSRRLKSVIWRWRQGRAVTGCDLLHATCVQEYHELRDLGLRQPIAIVPNGIDIPEIEDMPETKTDRQRKLLFLSRIHPKKGLEDLLLAWKEVMGCFPDWRLEILGPDNFGYLNKMQDLALELGLQRVEFKGPVYKNEKQRAYFEADIYILPTHSENFGITVAEALASGTPAIVSKGAPWQGLGQRNAGWWIDIGTEALVECLKQALGLDPEELEGMGVNGRQWMAEEFAWDRIGNMMFRAYTWILKGGPQPDWIWVD